MSNIIVVFPKIEDAKSLKNILVRNGFQVTAICNTGAQAIHLADGLSGGIVISAYKLPDMMYREIKDCIPEGFEILLLASKNHLSERTEEDIVTLPMPFALNDLVSTVGMMQQNIMRKKKKMRLTPTKRTEGDKNVILEAKRLLMERNHLTEEEAHRYIQKNSMDSGTNMVETAHMVLVMMGIKC